MTLLRLADEIASPAASSALAGGLALRPAAGAEAAIGAMWERCSLETRAGRFHAPVRHIPAAYLRAVLADPAASVLAAVEPAGDVVGLASLIAGPGCGLAELGVLVEDAWQRRGIGGRLVAHLVAAAPARGITVLTASVLARNAPVADLLRRVPGEFSLARSGQALDVRVRLLQRRARLPGVPHVRLSHDPLAPPGSPCDVSLPPALSPRVANQPRGEASTRAANAPKRDETETIYAQAA